MFIYYNIRVEQNEQDVVLLSKIMFRIFIGVIVRYTVYMVYTHYISYNMYNSIRYLEYLSIFDFHHNQWLITPEQYWPFEPDPCRKH